MKEDLSKAIAIEMTLKMVETLPREQKERLIADAVARKLEELNLGYAISKALEAEAMVFVAEYTKTAQMQDRLRAKARQAVDGVIDGLQKGLGKEFEDYIKNKYQRIYSRD